MNKDILSTIKVRGLFQILSLENDEIVWESGEMPNLVLDSALDLIVQHHIGNNTNALEITSLEVGDGDTAVTATDTALDNMVVDAIPVAKNIPSGKSVIFEFFIVDAELADGTYKEIGLRAGPTLYTRALFTTPYLKVSGRDTIIRYTLTYSSS